MFKYIAVLCLVGCAVAYAGIVGSDRDMRMRKRGQPLPHRGGELVGRGGRGEELGQSGSRSRWVGGGRRRAQIKRGQLWGRWAGGVGWGGPPGKIEAIKSLPSTQLLTCMYRNVTLFSLIAYITNHMERARRSAAMGAAEKHLASEEQLAQDTLLTEVIHVERGRQALNKTVRPLQAKARLDGKRAEIESVMQSLRAKVQVIVVQCAWPHAFHCACAA